MTLEQFNTFCASLPHSQFVEQWRGSQVWKIGGKVFALGQSRGEQVAFTFKVSETHFLLLREQTGFRPAPYFAARGKPWIQQYGEFGDAEALRYYLTESYWLVASGLTQKERMRLLLV